MDRRAGAAVALVLALGGCGSSSHRAAPSTGDYVGKLRGHAAVAVIVGKATGVAYVCDWQRHVAEVFTGSRSGRGFTLRGAHGGTLTGSVGRTGVIGTFRTKGTRTTRFSAAVAKPPAGLYRARGRVKGKPVTAGWVVFGDGSQRGALTIASTTGAAPALNTSTSTATLSGTRLSAVRISSGSISQTGQMGQTGQIGQFGGG
jgi:hypothetical protein